MSCSEITPYMYISSILSFLSLEEKLSYLAFVTLAKPHIPSSLSFWIKGSVPNKKPIKPETASEYHHNSS